MLEREPDGSKVMATMEMAATGSRRSKVGGLAGWLLDRLHRNSRPQPRLALLERISLAPRQSLALVEAEGRRFLVVTSADGAPAFCALDDFRGAKAGKTFSTRTGARVSW
jgi:hypothetical protein